MEGASYEVFVSRWSIDGIFIIAGRPWVWRDGYGGGMQVSLGNVKEKT